VGVISAVIASAMLAVGGASAVEYNIKGMPELGRCVRVKKLTGEFRDSKCVKPKPGKTGKYNWLPGPGPSKSKFTVITSPVSFQSTGGKAATIKCGSLKGEGTWQTDKELVISKSTITACKNPAVVGEKTWCQSGEAAGVVEVGTINGEIGWVRQSKKVERKLIGLAIYPTIAFECENFNETLNKAITGTGTKREVVGAVIGITTPFDEGVPKFKTKVESVSGTQFPDHFENREKYTLTEIVGAAKEAEPALMNTGAELVDEQNYEIKALCKGAGC